MDFFNNIGKGIGDGINTVSGFFQPHQSKDLGGMASPVPQSQIVPHTVPSAYQQAVNNVQNTAGAIGNGIHTVTQMPSEIGGALSNFEHGLQQGLLGPTRMQFSSTQQAQTPPQRSLPGENAFVTNLVQKNGGNPAHYQQLYKQAVTSPGFSGNYYGATAPTTTPTPTATPTPTSVPQPEVEGIPTGTFSDFTSAPVPSPLQGTIYKAAQAAGVNPALLSALLFAEHGLQTTPGYNYNTDGSYDRGIAQINSKAHPEVSDAQALNPNFAIPYAAHLLGSHIKNMGDINRGIAAYNVGEGGASINGPTPAGIGPQGQHYIDAIGRGLSSQLRQKLGIKTSF